MRTVTDFFRNETQPRTVKIVECLRRGLVVCPVTHASTVRRHAPRHTRATRSSAAAAATSPASTTRSYCFLRASAAKALRSSCSARSHKARRAQPPRAVEAARDAHQRACVLRARVRECGGGGGGVVGGLIEAAAQHGNVLERRVGALPEVGLDGLDGVAEQQHRALGQRSVQRPLEELEARQPADGPPDEPLQLVGAQVGHERRHRLGEEARGGLTVLEGVHTQPQALVLVPPVQVGGSAGHGRRVERYRLVAPLVGVDEALYARSGAGCEAKRVAHSRLNAVGADDQVGAWRVYVVLVLHLAPVWLHSRLGPLRPPQPVDRLAEAQLELGPISVHAHADARGTVRDVDRIAVPLGRLLQQHRLQPVALHHARHVVLLSAGRAGRLEARLAESVRSGARVGGEAQTAIDARRVLVHALHAAKLAQCLLASSIETELVAALSRSPGGVGRGRRRRQRVVQVHAPATLGEHYGGQGSGGASTHHSSCPGPGLAGVGCGQGSGGASTHHSSCPGPGLAGVGCGG
eukprot:scaffold123058_cov72-Phaeocystis_antarctica.AAC.2